MATKKKFSKPKLNVDLKKYLDNNLAKDNLKLTKLNDELFGEIKENHKEIEALKAKLQDKEEELEDAICNPAKYSKEFKKIEDCLYSVQSNIDSYNMKNLTKLLKKLNNNLSLEDLTGILYSILDKYDGILPNLVDAIDDIEKLIELINDLKDKN